MNSIEDIKHTFYINLESRPDRKAHVEEELSKMGINATRFNAIRLANGAVGCSLSHLKCLEIAKKNNWDHLLIVEDDITFMNPTLFKTQINTFFSKNKIWDVILVAGNNMPPYTIIDNSCVKVNRCQTTTGYLVKSHYYDTLIKNIKEGIRMLMKEPENHKMYAIDKYWFQLQERDNWFLITPLTVTQKEGYSDIEKRITNYTHVMIDLDKKIFFEKQKQRQMQENALKMKLFESKPSMKMSMYANM